MSGTELRIILLGCPRAGKGTQAKALCGRYGLSHVSTGDLFRAEAAAKSALGRKVEDFMKRGMRERDAKERAKEATKGVIDAIKWLDDMDAVIVGRAKRNTANEGQTEAYSFVWDGTTATKGGAALLRVKTEAVKDIFWGGNFRWKEAQAYTRESPRGAYGGKEVRVVTTEVFKSTATDAGYLFMDCLLT